MSQQVQVFCPICGREVPLDFEIETLQHHVANALERVVRLTAVAYRVTGTHKCEKVVPASVQDRPPAPIHSYGH